MKRQLSLTVFAALLLALFALTTAGQITGSLTFETNFPFYAGNAKLPAGSYRIGPLPGEDQSALVIESSDGHHSVLVECIATQSESPHAQSDVTFKKYGDADFLNLIWVQGQNSGMEILPSKAEKMAAKNSSATRHSVAVKSGG